MKYLFIINDAPYGTEKAYNALRLAMQIQKDFPDNEVRIFLMADAATCALQNQNTPNSLMKKIMSTSSIMQDESNTI